MLFICGKPTSKCGDLHLITVSKAQTWGWFMSLPHLNMRGAPDYTGIPKFSKRAQFYNPTLGRNHPQYWRLIIFGLPQWIGGNHPKDMQKNCDCFHVCEV